MKKVLFYISTNQDIEESNNLRPSFTVPMEEFGVIRQVPIYRKDPHTVLVEYETDFDDACRNLAKIMGGEEYLINDWSFIEE